MHRLVVHDVPQHVVKCSGDVRVGRVENVDASVLAQGTDLLGFTIERASPAIVVFFEERVAEHVAPLDFRELFGPVHANRASIVEAFGAGGARAGFHG